MKRKLFTFLKQNIREIVIISALLTISAVAHGYNMFHYPYFENDEGTYASQAWAVLMQGKLAPYTYWYDHAPLGWIFLAVWTVLTGGFFTFGFSLNSGRVFMLVLHIFSSLFLYLIAKRLTKSTFVGIISVLIFSLSPLAIYFQRRILLDNIMTFWILLSLYLITIYNYRQKLLFIILSSLAFGIAILTKENAIFLIPVYLYYIYSISHQRHKAFAVMLWLSSVCILASFYFLYALLKNEFFPAHTLFGGNHDHVSLLQTLHWQYGRSGGGGILDFNKSSFWASMRGWMHDDPILIVLGLLATCVNLLIGRNENTSRIIALLAMALWIFLLRGGLVLGFYIIPLVPFLALNIAIMLQHVYKKLEQISPQFLQTLRYSPYAAMIVFLPVVDMHLSNSIIDNGRLYYSDQTTPQVQAVQWILRRIRPDSFYVIDDYAYIELHTKPNNLSKNAEWYWKVDLDPEIRGKVLKDKLQDIDYIALTPQMEGNLKNDGLDFTGTAWKNSTPLAKFWRDGWGVTFWATNYPQRILRSSWNTYKKQFIQNGRTIDPYNAVTTSEGQSYALLRSVWMDDKKVFDESWNWTKNQLQRSDGLFAWQFKDEETKEKVITTSTATDADEDIALALLYAYKQWQDPTYLDEAKKVIISIWNTEIVIVADTPYLTAGNWANTQQYIIMNPSYFSPAQYRIFAQYDPYHAWDKLVESSYAVLHACTRSPLDKSYGALPPEWCSLDKTTHAITQTIAPLPSDTSYAYNAFRIPWRIALDYQWNHTSEAKNYLSSLTLLGKQWNTQHKLAATYHHNGDILAAYESAAAYGGDIGYFLVTNPKEAHNVYKEKLQKTFYEKDNESYWDDPKNYYTQNWAWFGTALYANSIPAI